MVKEAVRQTRRTNGAAVGKDAVPAVVGRRRSRRRPQGHDGAHEDDMTALAVGLTGDRT
jgi:hypothetical protein